MVLGCLPLILGMMIIDYGNFLTETEVRNRTTQCGEINASHINLINEITSAMYEKVPTVQLGIVNASHCQFGRQFVNYRLPMI